MVARRGLISLAFAVVVTAWILAAVVSGADTGLLHLAPALTLCAPLLLGRYVGERRLATFAKHRHTTRRRSGVPIATPRSHVRLMRRGGRLVASSLAKRPPPSHAPHAIA